MKYKKTQSGLKEIPRISRRLMKRNCRMSKLYTGIIRPKAQYPSTSNGHLSANCKDVRLAFAHPSYNRFDRTGS